MSNQKGRKAARIRIEELPQTDKELTPEQQDQVEGGGVTQICPSDLSISSLADNPLNLRATIKCCNL